MPNASICSRNEFFSSDIQLFPTSSCVKFENKTLMFGYMNGGTVCLNLFDQLDLYE
jgi:hypothetical protein